MRATEFIYEGVVYEATVSGYDLQFTKHFFDQIKKRDISIAIVNSMLKRLDRVRKQIDSIDPDTSFNLYDRRSNVHVVVSKPAQALNKLYLITVYKDANFRGKNPVVLVR